MFAKNKKGKKDDKAAEEEEAKKKEEEEAAKKAEEEAAAKEAEEAAARKEAEEAAKRKEAEEAAKKKEAEEAAKKEVQAQEEKKKQEAEALKRSAEEAKSREEAERKQREDAEKKAEKEEKQRKTAQESRARQRWLGAPVPKGVEGSMAMGSVYDMKVAFGMIDKRNRGVLDRKQARNFCRCAGWILPDQELDMMLDGTLGTIAKLLGGANRGPVPNAGVDADSPLNPNRTFTFEELCDILEKNTKGSNGGMKDITDALSRLASQNAQIQRRKFQELITEAPDFTDGDVELILQMAGLQRASDIDCSTLCSRLLGSVASPPSGFEAREQRQKEQFAANPLAMYRSGRGGGAT